MSTRNEWYFWPITFAVPVLLVAALAIVLHFTVGDTDSVWIFAASAFCGAALTYGGLALGSWIAYKIQDRA